MPSEEKPFEVQGRQQMIDTGHPLGHSVVVGVLGFEGEFVQLMAELREQARAVEAYASIGGNTGKLRLTFGNQPHTDVLFARGLRCAKCSPDHVIVQEWRTRRDLRL